VATPTPITVSTPFVPTSLKFPDAQYSLAREMIIGPYAIRMWANTGADPSGFDSTVTIVAAGQPPVLIEQASGLDDLTGTDITGEGHPDVIVYTSTGEARCCSTVLMYDLGPTMVKVLETSTSECDGRFEDLNADGVYEFLTCTSLSVYPACCSAEAPKVKVILQYQSGRGYVPASPRFAQFYADDIARDTQVAEQKTPNPSCESDGANKCTVLPLVLDYLYAGLPEPAWAELYRLYTPPDVETFRAEIQSAVEQSPLYAPH